jgi:transposase
VDGSPDGDRRRSLATHTGAPLRDLSACYYEKWKTVHNRHRHWPCDGTWARVLADLRRGGDEDDGAQWATAVDATVVGAPARSPRPLPTERVRRDEGALHLTRCARLQLISGLTYRSSC